MNTVSTLMAVKHIEMFCIQIPKIAKRISISNAVVTMRQSILN